MTKKKKTLKQKRHTAKLLENDDIRRWYNNTARGSLVTADVYARRLSAICGRLGITPFDLVEMKKDDRYKFLLDFVDSEEKRGMSGSYITSSMKALKSWLSYNGIFIKRKIKIKGAERTPTLKDERVPTQKELGRIFRSATPRDRVSCAIMAFSGVRPEVLGDYVGHDGLTIGDFPEMEITGGKEIKIKIPVIERGKEVIKEVPAIEGGEVVFKKTPTIIKVREELSKSGKQYFTFLPSEGCEYLSEYLNKRLRNGEKFHSGTDIIAPKSNRKSFIRSIKISAGIRAGIRGAGFQWRPYVLRAYCDTQLLLSESKGKMAHAYRQFFMGHVGDMEARYTTNKGQLSEDMTEDMRGAYKRSESFLQTRNITDEEKEDRKIFFKRSMLKMSGMSEKEISTLDLEEITEGEIAEIWQRKEQKKAIGKVTGNGGSQKVIPISEVEHYINDGWEFVTHIPPDKAIIKFPN